MSDARSRDACQQISDLFARICDVRGQWQSAGSETEADRAIDAIEALTLEIAETPAPRLEACRLKAMILRERLLDMLDPSSPAEAVTLTLVASLVLDLARLEE